MAEKSGEYCIGMEFAVTSLARVSQKGYRRRVNMNEVFTRQGFRQISFRHVMVAALLIGVTGCKIPQIAQSADTLQVSLSGVPSSVVEGSSIEATVTVEGYDGNFSISWLLDSVEIAVRENPEITYEFGQTLEIGLHRIEVVVTGSDDAQTGRASRDFTVYSDTEEPPDNTAIQGIDINETNTGVPEGHALVDVSSSITVTEQWITEHNGGNRTIENKNFLSGAGLRIEVSDFTVQYCKFNGIGGIYLVKGNSGIVIQDCELDGNHENLGDKVAIMNEGVRIIRVHVHRWPRALWTGQGNIHVENCYFHDLTADNSGKHIENVYVAGGAGQTYLRNKFISNRCSIDGGRGAISASLAIYNEAWATFPALDTIRVEGNYFETHGGFAFYGGALSAKAAPYPKNMIVKDNIFGRSLLRYCGVYGPATAFDHTQPGSVWENNTWGPRGPYWVEGDPEEGDLIESPGIR